MNPFNLISSLDNRNHGKLIGIGSTAAGGKSVAINSIAHYYLAKGIDVLMFTENISTVQRSKKFLNKEKDFGILYMHHVFSYLNKEFFNTCLNAFLPYRKHYLGSFVIIIDSIFGEFSSDSNEVLLTRIVIFEKIKKINKNLKNEHAVKINRELVQFLKEISLQYNSDIVFTKQIRRTNANIELADFRAFSSEIYMCDNFFSVSKNLNNFEIKSLKDRSGKDNISIPCLLDVETLTLMTQQLRLEI